MDKIFQEIREERAQQDRQWGGPLHDDGHSMHDWVTYIVRYMGRGVTWSGNWSPIWRRAMVQVAALAVAAIESADRQAPHAE